MKRRDFNAGILKGGLLLPFATQGVFAKPLLSPFRSSSVAFDKNILVLINLSGGNDGLNTVVPFEDQKYYDARPNLNIPIHTVLPISVALGLNPVISQVHSLYNSGDCAVVNNVGYPDQNRSHFRSADIWHTAAEAHQELLSGWLGRHLEATNQDFPDIIPEHPIALQLSTRSSLVLNGEQKNMGSSIFQGSTNNTPEFGLDEVYDSDIPFERELSYIQTLYRLSFGYKAVFEEATQQGKNYVEYGPDSLPQQLKTIAQLIDGGISTSIYCTDLDGFDTHSNQANSHENLLRIFSNAIDAFMNDLRKSGNAHRVVCLTYSEFGRRLEENGALGTDHGAAAPLFVFGEPIVGNQMLGGNPDLLNVDASGDIKYTVDFRRLYSTMLQHWLGASQSDTAKVLGGSFETLPLFNLSSVSHEDRARFAGIRLSQNVPNPAREHTTIHFSLPRSAPVVLTLNRTNGQHAGTFLDRTLPAGTHHVEINTAHLPAGAYIYTLFAGAYRTSKRMVVG